MAGGCKHDVHIDDNIKVVTTVAFSAPSYSTHFPGLDDFLNDLCSSLFSSRSTKSNRIVSLNLEWRLAPHNNQLATIQLCHGNRCLIFQLAWSYGQYVPHCLKYFLTDEAIWFVGVGINDNLAKLEQHYGIICKSGKELGPMADEYFGESSKYANSGLVELTELFLGLSAVNPELIRRSNWSATLTKEQIYYATRDAYFSYAIGNELRDYMD